MKFVCGVPGPRGVALPRGQYATVINVHNPSLIRAAAFSFKVAQALPGLQAGTITSFENVRLPADGALQIDCPTILDRLQEPIFADGFVVLLSPGELDVVAVYTAAEPDTTGGQVRSLHTERVEPILVEVRQ